MIAASVGSGPGTGGGAVTPGARAAARRSPPSVRRGVHIHGVRAQAGVVVDSASGSVLWTHDAHRRLPIASLTKLMTALLALPPRAGARPQLRRDPAMLGVPGSTIGLRAGARVTSRHMIAAMLIASANDAANVLAVHRAGSLARVRVAT